MQHAIHAGRRDDVPVVIVMKAMGVESDQEVASLVGPEPGFAELMLPSMEAASEAAVFTQQQALEWLSAYLPYTPDPEFTYNSAHTCVGSI